MTAIGRKAALGPLYRISNDVGSALAIAVTYTLRDTTAQLVWILAPRLPEPEAGAQADE